jgi:hypothetical protein
MTDQPPAQQQGMLERGIASVKGLSLANVLVIALLVMLAIPTYALWRLLNDSAMLGRVLSSYEEITSDKTPCTLRIASLRGAGDTYSISAGFAFQGSERWTIAVLMDRKPTDEEMYSYCETLQLLIDAMRDPTKHPPPFPGTEDPIIHMYPDGP